MCDVGERRRERAESFYSCHLFLLVFLCKGRKNWENGNKTDSTGSIHVFSSHLLPSPKLESHLSMAGQKKKSGRRRMKDNTRHEISSFIPTLFCLITGRKRAFRLRKWSLGRESAFCSSPLPQSYALRSKIDWTRMRWPRGLKLELEIETF